ncbi:MAG: YicC/YloC family endoribonuclease [Vicinamibacteria bacterium]
MIRSMTGFARGQFESSSYLAEVELRSVNHRYQDVRVRVPSSLAHLEAKIRNEVSSRVKRGKVDVSVRLKPKEDSTYQLELDRPLIEDFVKVARELGQQLGVGGELTLSDLVGFQPGFSVKERDLSDLSGGDGAWKALEPALTQALDEYDRMSRTEGQQLAADIDRRVLSIAEHIDAIEGLSTASKEKKRQEILDRIKELSGTGIEPSALAIEVARLVERSDITEELIRFRSHVTLWREAVRAEGPCGKKLDFIIQEMNREVNTIGSKCQDAAITESVIAIKSELERIREQVQNIE